MNSLKTIFVESFDSVDDPVKTEKTIHIQLCANASNIKTDYVYVSLPIAWIINKRGLHQAQKIITEVCKSHENDKLFFVCQHIQTQNLDFHGKLVFTPHATILNSFSPIPHYSCNYDTSFSRPWDKRKYEFSFMGDFGTHQSRKYVCDILKDHPSTVFIDTKRWHFYSDSKIQKINKKNYIELLGNTKYSLCPRGTGPSTIRIWESIAMNSCPLIFSDYLKMPLELSIKENLWFKLQEQCASIQGDYTEDYNNEEYWNLFSNSNLYKSITAVL